MKPIRAVTVDFWGTLVFDTRGPGHDRYRQQRLADFHAVLTAAGFGAPPEQLAEGYEASGRLLRAVWAEQHDLPVEAHVRAILDGAEPGLAARVPPATLGALVEAYSRPALSVPLEADPGARRALRALARRGLALGVVSNSMRTPGAVLRRVLERHGLLASFTCCTFSDEVGVRKPAPEIFHLTLARLGVAPEEAVHVGDDPVLDVQGARNAGMRVVRVGAPRAAGEPEPDLLIPGLAGLPHALARLEDRA